MARDVVLPVGRGVFLDVLNDLLAVLDERRLVLK